MRVQNKIKVLGNLERKEEYVLNSLEKKVNNGEGLIYINGKGSKKEYNKLNKRLKDKKVYYISDTDKDNSNQIKLHSDDISDKLLELFVYSKYKGNEYFKYIEKDNNYRKYEKQLAVSYIIQILIAYAELERKLTVGELFTLFTSEETADYLIRSLEFSEDRAELDYYKEEVFKNYDELEEIIYNIQYFLRFFDDLVSNQGLDLKEIYKEEAVLYIASDDVMFKKFILLTINSLITDLEMRPEIEIKKFNLVVNNFENGLDKTFLDILDYGEHQGIETELLLQKIAFNNEFVDKLEEKVSTIINIKSNQISEKIL